MRRENSAGIILPEPYIYCPFTQNSADVKGHLTWDYESNMSYSSTGARFTGSSYLRSVNKVQSSNFITFCFYARFDEIPTDGVSSTWQTTHYIMGNNSEQYRYYGYLQHYSAENVELVNALMTNSFSVDDNVLTTPWGSTQTNTWYRFVTRKNAIDTDLWVSDVHRKVNYVMNSVYNLDIIIGRRKATDRYMKGYIRDFTVWNTALTDEQIAAL